MRESLSGKNLSQLAEILKGYKSLHNITDIDTRDRALRAIEIQEYYLRHPEEAANSDRKKVAPLSSVVIGLDIPREERRARISRRLETRLDDGMVEEVRHLIETGVKAEDLIYYGLEYKYVTLHVIGELSFQEMKRQLEIAIHQFAKRQMTWFRGMERRGIPIIWIPYDLSEEEFLSKVKVILTDGV